LVKKTQKGWPPQPKRLSLAPGEVVQRKGPRGSWKPQQTNKPPTKGENGNGPLGETKNPKRPRENKNPRRQDLRWLIQKIPSTN